MSMPVMPLRDPAALLARTLAQWREQRGDLWIFAYASLLWHQEFAFSERRRASVHGWHRSLQMYSRVNRGTPQFPGLVFALLSGGCCQGLVFRVPQTQAPEVLAQLWQREMPLAVYEPRWLRCTTSEGRVAALAFTLSRASPSFTGELAEHEYQRIFAHARGKYGSTRDYAQATHAELLRLGIRDRSLARLIRIASAQSAERHR